MFSQYWVLGFLTSFTSSYTIGQRKRHNKHVQLNNIRVHCSILSQHSSQGIPWRWSRGSDIGLIPGQGNKIYIPGIQWDQENNNKTNKNFIPRPHHLHCYCNNLPYILAFLANNKQKRQHYDLHCTTKKMHFSNFIRTLMVSRNIYLGLKTIS